MSDRRGTASAQSWQSAGGVIEGLTFGTSEQDAIDQAVSDFAVRYLGSEPATVLFRSCSSHVVYGIELHDRRRVVIKTVARMPAEALLGTQAVQRHLHRSGFPCPEPLVGPQPLGLGVAVAERFVDAGEVADTHRPEHRRLVAEALAWHLELTEKFEAPAGTPVGWDFAAVDSLWPAAAHSAAIDLHAPVEGGQEIDRLAELAREAGRRISRSTEPRLAGHHDWSGKHFRVADGRVTAVYDWDSVMLGREAVVVGNAAMTHTANYDLPGAAIAPTPEEVSAFIDDYLRARARSHVPPGREAIAAAATYLGAYSARCEMVAGHPAKGREGSFTQAMRSAGEGYLEA